jgi:hypothetical protein
MKNNRPILFSLIIIILATIFSEAIGMLILHHTRTPYNNLVLLDSLLLVIFLIPVIFLFVYRPISLDMKKLFEINEEKDKIIKKLNLALDEIKKLEGVIPICASCKNIRDDLGYWTQVEQYISEHSDAKFSHGICPKCVKKLYPELYKEK